jgi:hypothetical protein
VNAGGEIALRGLGRRSVDRLAAGFLLLLLAAGSLVLWIGIPTAGLWALSKLTDSSTGHFLLSLFLIPLAMVLFAPALFWLNGLYLRVTGVLRLDDDDEDRERRLRGPLELFLYAGMVLALVAFLVWLFFFAHTPPWTVW